MIFQFGKIHEIILSMVRLSRGVTMYKNVQNSTTVFNIKTPASVMNTNKKGGTYHHCDDPAACLNGRRRSTGEVFPVHQLF